jgi:hypothetical protein
MRDFLAPGPVINVECKRKCAAARVNVIHVESLNQIVVAVAVVAVDSPLLPLALA